MIKDGRQDEFGRSPDNEIKAVTPTGNTSTTLNEEEERIQKYKNIIWQNPLYFLAIPYRQNTIADDVAIKATDIKQEDAGWKETLWINVVLN